MIEITLGLLLVTVSIVIFVCCLIALVVTGPVFKKQREQLLKQIGEE